MIPDALLARGRLSRTPVRARWMVLMKRQASLFSVDDSVTFTNGENLVGFNVRQLLNFLRGGPLHFNQVDHSGLTNSKVQSQVTLRHDAGAARHFVHLGVASRHHFDPRTNRGAIAL